MKIRRRLTRINGLKGRRVDKNVLKEKNKRPKIPDITSAPGKSSKLNV